MRGAIATKQSRFKNGIASLPLVARNDAVHLSSCPNFSLATTLTSGQVFRWREVSPGGFAGWINSSLVEITQKGPELSFRGASPKVIGRFFSLDVDLPSLTRRIDVDPIIHQAIQSHWGLRLIRQDPWECTASFILSSFNNIPRLTGMLETLAVKFGESVEAAGPLFYRFPTAERLAKVSERVLRNCGLGFRAPYLRAAAQRVAGGAADLERWRSLEDEALRRSLLTIPGIGEKVVECVLLFGYGRAAAFPVDVWIGRTMRAWYFRRRKVTDRRIREFARAHFGAQCGWAQQYLYCYARTTAAESFLTA